MNNAGRFVQMKRLAEASSGPIDSGPPADREGRGASSSAAPIKRELQMTREMDRLMPEARRKGLVVQELSDELLVFDRNLNKAHCLNRTAGLVWRHCDGASSVADVARAIADETNAPVDEDLVWLGVEQLSKSRLLEERVMLPEQKTGLSRREVIRRIGLAAAVALPVVTSIVAPTAAQAANCFTAGQGCTASAQCCSGVCSGGVCS